MRTLSRFIRIALPIAILLCAAVAVPMKLLDANGFPRVDRLGRELMQLNEKNRQLIRENDALRGQIQAFHSDPEYIGKVARDELGMVLPGEIIYQFPNAVPE